jgi:single-strand DNA-binding protein
MPNIAQSAQIHKNECHLAGFIAKAPDLRYTTSGKAVATLTLGTKYKESTEFHRVVCWEQLAEKAGLVTKGTFVQIVGRLQTRSWDDKQSGQKKYITEVVAWQFVVPGKEPVTPNIHGVEATDADIPF